MWKALQKERPGVRFDYLNAAVPGYTTEASLRNLLLRVKPLQPDVIVFYEATNDLAVDTLHLARQQGLVAGDAEATSWPARYSMLWFLVEKNLTVRRGRPRRPRVESWWSSRARCPASSSSAWRRSSPRARRALGRSSW